MNRFITAALVLILGIGLAPAHSFARGFGGFHGGGGFSGGGYHGGGFSGGSFGGGGFHADSFSGGGYHAGGFEGGLGGGGFHADSFSGGGYHADSFGGGAYHADSFGGGAYHADSFGSGGYHAGGYGGSVNRGQLDSFLGLPTDGGFHAAAGAEGHVYQAPGGATVAHGSAGVRGAAVGPYGAAAGGRYASGTVVRGPEGNTYAHATTAGRGIAAGPNGVVAGRSYGTYGTHPWSPTYYHSQALAGRDWCYGNHLYSPGWCTIHPWAWMPAGYAAADWAAAAWATATWGSVGSWLGYADRRTVQLQLRQLDRLPGRPGLLWQPGGRHRATVLPGGRQPRLLPGQRQPAPDAQWLPLGVFGLMANGKKTPDMVFQLAVDRNGTIRGNYFDQVTQNNLPVTGAVDKHLQRVAWKVATGQGLVVETGLANLTQDESTALVHFGPDRTEQDLLVRIKQPADGQSDPINQASQ